MNIWGIAHSHILKISAPFSEVQNLPVCGDVRLRKVFESGEILEKCRDEETFQRMCSPYGEITNSMNDFSVLFVLGFFNRYRFLLKLSTTIYAKVK